MCIGAGLRPPAGRQLEAAPSRGGGAIWGSRIWPRGSESTSSRARRCWHACRRSPTSPPATISPPPSRLGLPSPTPSSPVLAFAHPAAQYQISSPLLAPRRIYPSHPATLRLILPPPPPLSALSHPNDIRMSPCPGLCPMSSHDARRGPASNPSPANIRPRPATRLRLLVCPPPSTTWPSQTQSSEDRRSTGAAARPSPTPRKPNFPPPPSRRGAIISGGSDIVPNIHDTCEDRLSVGVITVTHRPHVARNMAITTLYHIILAPRPAVIHTV